MQGNAKEIAISILVSIAYNRKFASLGPTRIVVFLQSD